MHAFTKYGHNSQMNLRNFFSPQTASNLLFQLWLQFHPFSDMSIDHVLEVLSASLARQLPSLISSSRNLTPLFLPLLFKKKILLFPRISYILSSYPLPLNPYSNLIVPGPGYSSTHEGGKDNTRNKKQNTFLSKAT